MKRSNCTDFGNKASNFGGQSGVEWAERGPLRPWQMWLVLLKDAQHSADVGTAMDPSYARH